MNLIIRKITGVVTTGLLVLVMSINTFASTVSIDLYHTGIYTGDHDHGSYTLTANPVYTFKENSHTGSFSSLGVYINNVHIGNLTSSSLTGSGYPINYNVSAGSAHIDVYLLHGSGAASFSGSITY